MRQYKWALAPQDAIPGNRSRINGRGPVRELARFLRMLLEAGADDYIPKDIFANENLISTLQAFDLDVGS